MRVHAQGMPQHEGSVECLYRSRYCRAGEHECMHRAYASMRAVGCMYRTGECDMAHNCSVLHLNHTLRMHNLLSKHDDFDANELDEKNMRRR